MKRTMQTLRQAHIILRACFFALFLAAAILPQAATAQTVRYVKPLLEGGTDTGNGLTWGSASSDLQEMINQSDTIAGDEVWVYKGTYTPRRTADGWNSVTNTYPTSGSSNGRDNAFVFKAGVKIYGGFTSGVTGTVPEFGTAGRNGISTLSGDFGTDSVYHVVIGVNISSDNPAVLDGFTVSGGNADGSYSDITVNGQSVYRNSGGGIANYNSSPVLAHVTISGNQAGNFGGGGIYNNSSSPVLTHVTISGNQTGNGNDGLGGGICNTNSSSLQLTHVTISGNQAGNGGGGICNINSSSLQLTHVIISGNKAYGGGGIYNDSFLQLTDVTISGNTATSSNGGGIYNSSSSAVLTRVTINENSATNGGGICNLLSSPQLTDVIISGNQATGDGGGICNYNHSSPVLTNVTISRNTATGNGGGIYNNSASSPALTNVTIRGNTATGNGGGIYNYSNYSYYSSPRLTNTIVWENSSSVYNSGFNSPVYAYSLVEGEALTGTNLDDTNPMNNPQFISPVDSRLKATSPAINRGNNAAYLTARSLSDFTGETDPAGQPRLWDGVIDMGAYEFSFTIALSPATPYTMPAETYGCSDCSPLTVTVTNTGSRPTGTLTVALSGANPGTFALSAAALSGIPVGGTGNFVLSPAAGLAAGSYDATVTVSGDNGISASLDVSFTLNRAKPTVGELDFDLSDAVYTDRPRPVGVGVGAAAGVSGLGGITVRYNGLTRLPDEPGTYAVTVDITEGVNYLAVEGLLLGTFTVRAPVQPGPIRRTVTLPSVSGLTTDPPAGRHYVSSGTDFTFTLIPDTPSPNGAPPAVQTNRTALPDADGLRITPNADGSYTVVIRSIRQDLEVAFSAATGADALEQTALTVYAVPGAIAVGNARSEAVDLRIYTLAGTLVRRLTAAPGTTRLTAAPGVYIVVTGDGRRQKTFISD